MDILCDIYPPYFRGQLVVSLVFNAVYDIPCVGILTELRVLEYLRLQRVITKAIPADTRNDPPFAAIRHDDTAIFYKPDPIVLAVRTGLPTRGMLPAYDVILHRVSDGHGIERIVSKLIIGKVLTTILHLRGER